MTELSWAKWKALIFSVLNFKISKVLVYISSNAVQTNFIHQDRDSGF